VASPALSLKHPFTRAALAIVGLYPIDQSGLASLARTPRDSVFHSRAALCSTSSQFSSRSPQFSPT
jgi:hypothetical protein